MQRHWDDSASVTCGDALHLQLSFLVVLSWRLAAGSSRLSSRNLGCESQKRDLSSARSPDAHMYWRASHRVTAAATEHLGHLIATKPRYSHPLFCVPNIDNSFSSEPACRSRDRLGLVFLRLRQVALVEDHSDHETAAGAHGNLFAVAQVIDGDLETVAAGARVCVCL